MSFPIAALETLRQHEVDPHHLLRMLHTQKAIHSYVNTETHVRWNYMARQRSHLFLLAKPDDSYSRYQDILSVRPL